MRTRAAAHVYVVSGVPLGYGPVVLLCSKEQTTDLVKGYMDFETFDYYRANGVKYYWGFDVGLSCIILVAGLAYIVMVFVALEQFTYCFGRRKRA